MTTPLARSCSFHAHLCVIYAIISRMLDRRGRETTVSWNSGAMREPSSDHTELANPDVNEDAREDDES